MTEAWVIAPSYILQLFLVHCTTDEYKSWNNKFIWGGNAIQVTQNVFVSQV